MNFFTPTCSKISVECDWNRISQKGQNLNFFWEKTLKFFNIAKCGKFFVECVLKGIISEKRFSALNVKFFCPAATKNKY